MTLVDTSAWVAVLAKSARVKLTDYVAIEEVVTCPPIVQEILQGIRDEHPYRIAKQSLLALPTIGAPLSQDLFVAAADLYRLARRKGKTVRSSVDCLIAACALAWDIEVLHDDRDFAAIASVSALRQRSMR